MVTKEEREKRRKQLERDRQQSIPKDDPRLPPVTEQPRGSGQEDQDLSREAGIKSGRVQPGGIAEVGGTTFIAGSSTSDVQKLRSQQELDTPEAQARRAEEEQLERGRGEFQRVSQEDGLIPGQAPERVELETQGFAEPLKRLFNDPAPNSLIGKIKNKKSIPPEEELEVLTSTPEGQKQAMISVLREAEFERADESTEALGTLIEAIPIVGSLARQYAGDLVRTPSSKADEIRDRISEIEGRASAMTDAAAQGELGDTTEVLRKLRKMDGNIEELEAKLQYLIIQSPILQNNPEEVNLIEEEILRTRETIFEGQQRAQEGAFLRPSNENLFLRLQELE